VDPKAQKQLQFTIFASFVVLVLLLSVQALFLMPPRTAARPELASVAYLVAAASALACLGWVFSKLKFGGQVGDAPTVPAPATFQTNFVVALAFAEVPALMGFAFSLVSGVSVVPFTAISLLLFFVIVLPKLFQFWQIYEGQA
jgi:hypothetical protein